MSITEHTTGPPKHEGHAKKPEQQPQAKTFAPDPRDLSSQLLYLQRTAGNHAVNNFLRQYAQQRGARQTPGTSPSTPEYPAGQPLFGVGAQRQAVPSAEGVPGSEEISRRSNAGLRPATGTHQGRPRHTALQRSPRSASGVTGDNHGHEIKIPATAPVEDASGGLREMPATTHDLPRPPDQSANAAMDAVVQPEPGSMIGRISTAVQEVETVQRLAGSAPFAQMLQREEDGEDSGQGGQVQARAEVGLEGGPLSPELAGRIQAKQGGGAPLDPGTQDQMEDTLGTSLTGVSVHTDGEAVALSRSVSAVAFTSGRDIFFSQNAYDPATPSGQQLLAHELTHVVQQRSMSSSGPMTVGPAGDSHEQEAEAVSATVARQSDASRKQAAPDQTALGTDAPAAQRIRRQAAATEDEAEAQPMQTRQASSAALTAQRYASSPAGAPPIRPQRVTAVPTVIQRRVAPAATGTRAPVSPADDPAFQAVAGRAHETATKHKAHPPAKAKAAQAQAAAVSPPNEVTSQAAASQTTKMDQQQPRPFDKAAFKQALMQKIAELAPKSLEEVDNFKGGSKVKSMQGALTAQVGQSKKQAQGGMEEKAKEPPDPSGITPKPVTPLPPSDAGSPPPSVSATPAAPKPKTDAEVSLQPGSQELDHQMTEANVSEEQLKQSNEPEFQSAVDAKHTAQADAAQAPHAYRTDEHGMLTHAQTEAQDLASKHTGAMHDARTRAVTQAAGHQVEAKGKDEAARARVASDIQGMYEATKKRVEERLTRLDADVTKTFDQGATAAQQAFENSVKREMDAYKEKRYSGLDGAVLWATDKLKITSLPDEVNQFYEHGKTRFEKDMDGVLDTVAAMVETGLTEAKNEIATGKKQVDSYVTSLAPALQQVGQEAARNIQSKFSELEQNVNEKQSQLINSLASKYNEKLQQIDARITQMKEANKGWVDKAKAAVGGVIDTIKNLKDMLLNVLARAGGVIEKIIKHPIDFLGNLVSGIKQGLHNFMSNIGTHLKKGLLGWLFGALAEAGIHMPETFDLKGILSLVLQVLGLTYANIRARAVKIVGEKTVGALEKGAEIFKVLMQGPEGIWEWIKDKLSDLKEMVLGPIEKFVGESVIVAGITWIVSLLNPASAFIKACKAIYDIIMFFVERGSQIMSLVNAVLDSVSAIAEGAIGGAATMVENALGKAVPVAISFLASLLGLGGISEKIKSVITAIQEPVNGAIDWVIGKAVSMVKTVGEKLGFGKKGDKGPDERTDEQKDTDERSAQAEVEVLVHDDSKTADDVKAALPGIRSGFKLTTLEMKEEPSDETREDVTITGFIQRAIDPVKGIKLRGFTDEEMLIKFGSIIRTQLTGLVSYYDAYVQGSAFTGKNFHTGEPFGEHSDIDLAIVSKELFDAATGEQGADIRGEKTGPNPLPSLLNPLRQELSVLVKREVNIMVYKGLAAVMARGGGHKVP